MEDLYQHNIVAQYLPGPNHGNADALSRMYTYSEVSHAYSDGVNLADLPVEDANTVRGLTRIWGTSPMTSWGWIGPTLGIPKG